MRVERTAEEGCGRERPFAFGLELEELVDHLELGAHERLELGRWKSCGRAGR